jgi:hypothetical protein
MSWPMVQTGKPADPSVQATMSSGNGLIRPLEAAAKRGGVEILFEHRMTAIYRQPPNAGPVVGVAGSNRGKSFNFRAHKAVIIATGGSTMPEWDAACKDTDVTEIEREGLIRPLAAKLDSKLDLQPGAFLTEAVPRSSFRYSRIVKAWGAATKTLSRLFSGIRKYTCRS